MCDAAAVIYCIHRLLVHAHSPGSARRRHPYPQPLAPPSALWTLVFARPSPFPPSLYKDDMRGGEGGWGQRSELESLINKAAAPPSSGGGGHCFFNSMHAHALPGHHQAGMCHYELTSSFILVGGGGDTGEDHALTKIFCHQIYLHSSFPGGGPRDASSVRRAQEQPLSLHGV